MKLNEAVTQLEGWISGYHAGPFAFCTEKQDVEAVETLMAFARKRRPIIVKALPCPKCGSTTVACRMYYRTRESAGTVYCRKCGYSVDGPWVKGDGVARNAARELWNAEPREVACEPE